jgi:ABC-2 type transport system ATP-binding protein
LQLLLSINQKFCFSIKSILKSFTRNGGTVILATHVLEVAQKICTRLGIINRGEFIALGTMEEIKKSSSFTELEDIFLELTGGERYRDILDYLGKEENLYNLF